MQCMYTNLYDTKFLKSLLQGDKSKRSDLRAGSNHPTLSFVYILLLLLKSINKAGGSLNTIIYYSVGIFGSVN